MNEDEREEREDLARYYEALTPAQRRDQVLLQPAYREQYNEITQAHRIVVQPDYFWERWVPILGPVAACLYMRLRQLSFEKPGAAGHAECWPTQKALAASLGVKKTDSIRGPLRTLEQHGFIERAGSFITHPTTGQVTRGPDRYLVFFEIPLTPSDAAELLIRSVSPNTQKTGTPEYPKNGQSATEYPKNGHSDQVGLDQEPSPNTQKTGNRPNTQKTGSNVNVNGSYKERSTFSCPENGQSVHEALAEELVEELADPRSRRFFRLVAEKVPEGLVRLALSEARAARAEGTLRGSLGAYFTGAVKRLTADAGIEL